MDRKAASVVICSHNITLGLLKFNFEVNPNADDCIVSVNRNNRNQFKSSFVYRIWFFPLIAVWTFTFDNLRDASLILSHRTVYINNRLIILRQSKDIWRLQVGVKKCYDFMRNNRLLHLIHYFEAEFSLSRNSLPGFISLRTEWYFSRIKRLLAVILLYFVSLICR